MGSWIKRFQKIVLVCGQRYFSEDILVENGAAFCPCPKNLAEAKLKLWIDSFGRGHFQTAYYWLCCLGMSGHIMQIYNEKEQTEQGKIQNV